MVSGVLCWFVIGSLLFLEDNVSSKYSMNILANQIHPAMLYFYPTCEMPSFTVQELLRCFCGRVSSLLAQDLLRYFYDVSRNSECPRIS
ncbi:hypothetical protein AVEN_106706-1 [Araneus ventricosus]|uniref:Secreted protein n=1 Tax=Araneus ventricosus TaxID=182803 RepID=A0A4Y2EYZ8_ARAVE|nr:hypothetical protein AVEN_106706-1 [Araneus ventricosus]